MADFLGSIWWLLVTLGILVTFHEFGHFWVARRCGVKVLRFSVGFGRPLWRRVGKDGTEYVVAAIPLGGYVKMLDERDQDVPAALRDQAFNRKTVGQRIAIVAAGPGANLLFMIFAFWLMFMVGVRGPQPVLGPTEGLAAAAGLQAGDRLLSIDGRPVDTWVHATMSLVGVALDRRAVPVQVRDLEGRERQLVLPLDRLERRIDEQRVFEELGIRPWHFDPGPMIGSVSPGKPAERAGLRPGDRVLAVNGEPTLLWTDLFAAIQKHAGQGPMELRVRRGSIETQLMIQAEPGRAGDGSTRWLIGIAPETFYAVNRLGPLEALPASIHEGWRITTETLAMLWRMLTGQASLKNLSGPITIAQVSNDSARLGLAQFLFFLGVISLSLAVVNLLPIPMLDGGHLMYYLIELATGRPVSESVEIAGQYVGLAMLAGLMGLAFYNDLFRLLSGP